MTRTTAIRGGVTAIVVTLICVLAASRGARIDSEAAWYSVVPPLLAVALALATHRLLLSLAIGVVAGGFLAAVPARPAAVGAWAHGAVNAPRYVWSVITDPFNLQILAFVALVLAMITVLLVAGGLQGIVNWLARFARGPRSTQVITALMGLAIFIDDYANTMIVGSSMRPMSDRHGVSREKLAFLVDATSAPIAGVAVVSTWIGYEVGLFSQVGESLAIPKSGYAMFFDALAFRFYCFMMILFVLTNAITGRDYGSMRKAQWRVASTGQVAAPDAKPLTSQTLSAARPTEGARIRARTAVIPLAGLFAFLLTALWFDGGGPDLAAAGGHHALSLTTWRTVLGQAENNVLILAVAAAFSLVIAAISALAIAGLRTWTIGKAILAGLRGSLLPMTILVMAWSLKAACDGLSTGIFLVDAVGEVVSPVWFPALVFILAGLTAFATGTSWGTMAILIPTAIPIAFRLDGDAYGLVTMMSLGAVLDGAILGDHCSPISDTTIMSSIASSCDHIHHVATQLPYSLTVGALALTCGYLPAALGVPSWAGLLLAAAVILALHVTLRRRRRSVYAEAGRA